MYYVDAVLGIGQTVTVDPPASSQVEFTYFPTISVDDTYDLIVADGDDFIPDILGIGTTGIGGVLAGSGGRVRADNYTGRAGDAPNFPQGVVLSGITTVGVVTGGTSVGASKFYGALVGDVTGDVTGDLTGTSSTATAAANAYGITGAPNVSLADIQVSGSCTISGNLTVDGTQTIINTSTLDIEDKTVGIASTTNASNTTADGAGIEIYASSSTASNNKTITWENASNCFVKSDPDRLKGVSETVATATTYINGSDVVLEMDLRAATVYTYTMPVAWSGGNAANIGVVSFKNMYVDTANGTTVTLIVTEAANHGGGTGYGNTVSAVGFGATCTIIPLAGNSEVAGIQTAGQFGGTGLLSNNALTGISTVTLSPAKDAVDFISFFIHYNGGTNTDLKSYKVYVTKNGGFGFGPVGI